MRARPKASVRTLAMAHQTGPFCMPQPADTGYLGANQNGGSARVLPRTGSFWIAVALASSSVARRMGPVTLDSEAGRGSRRRA
jgi:hypothetical protein